MGKINALQLVITLVGSEPPIWRRVIVPERLPWWLRAKRFFA